MKKIWLLIDASYLAHRSFHALKNMPAADIGTEVVYGFMRDIVKLQERFTWHGVAFCFDHGESLRTDILPTYKSSRKARHEAAPKDEQRKRQKLYDQLNALRREHLPQIGFQNIFAHKGYEADDVIASICLHSLNGNRAIIVSQDHDYYQLLQPDVKVWHPQQQHMMTLKKFQQEYDILPEQWATVKAIAGCRSDDVPGIPGIGEITAAKFVRGSLNPELKAYKKILDNLRVWKQNLPLVKLPFEGVDRFKLRKDEVTIKKWKTFARNMDMMSLLSLSPEGSLQNEDKE